MRTAVVVGFIVLAVGVVGCGGGAAPTAGQIEKAFLADVRAALAGPGHEGVAGQPRGFTWRSMSNDFGVVIERVEVRGGAEGCNAVAILSAKWLLNGKSATGSGAGDPALQAHGLLMGSSVPHRCCWSAKAKACTWSEALGGSADGAKVERVTSSSKQDTASFMLRRLVDSYMEWDRGMGRCPSSLAKLDPSNQGRDPWGNELRFFCRDNLPPEVKADFGVVSAGPDGTFNTADDVRSW